jgi:hypothetical protein
MYKIERLRQRITDFLEKPTGIIFFERKVVFSYKIVIFAEIFNSDEYKRKVDKTIFATAQRFYMGRVCTIVWYLRLYGE